MNVLIAPQHWGLGHITRSIPVIRYFIDRGDKVTLACSGAGIELLNKEFPQIECLSLIDYGVKYPSKNMVANMALYLFNIHRAIIVEHFQIKKICKEKQIDLVVSDARLGATQIGIKSIIITHHLHFPIGNKLFEFVSALWVDFFYKRFDEMWVPDLDGENNLAGDLAHQYKWSKKYYIGAISRFEKLNLPKQYDIAIILSGPEPQRSYLEAILLNQLSKWQDKNIILVRGINQVWDKEKLSNLDIITLANSKQLNEVICASDFIICRSGYTSLLDLYKLEKKALLIPTPGQPEQIYLAEELMKKKLFYTVQQDNIDLEKDIPLALQYSAYQHQSEKETLKQILDRRLANITQ
ncbi:MAG: glycosyltransferase [Saprospiraceae bacterium]|nr:glycosyltransferase [Saprospiraceae bacterium]